MTKVPTLFCPIYPIVRSRLLFINYLSTPGPIFKFLFIVGNHLFLFALGPLKLGFLSAIGCKNEMSCPLEIAILAAIPLYVEALGSGYTDEFLFENAYVFAFCLHETDGEDQESPIN